MVEAPTEPFGRSEWPHSTAEALTKDAFLKRQNDPSSRVSIHPYVLVRSQGKLPSPSISLDFCQLESKLQKRLANLEQRL